jgi:hypothetical protein
MQSSAMVALRTMTMIVCLVAVPLAAVLGTTLPKVVKSAFGHGEARQTGQVDENVISATVNGRERAAAAKDPIPSVPMPPNTKETQDDANEPTLPRVRITGVRPLDESPMASEPVPNEPPLETAPLWNPSPRTASTPRGRQTTTHFVPSSLPLRVRRPRRHADANAELLSHDVRLRGERRGETLQKTVYSQPDEADANIMTPEQSGGGPDLTGQRMAPVERVANRGALADGEQRLRELGATYYRLEAWGNDGSFYRCSCSVPLAERSRATRHFESIEAAPSQAIGAVVKQVETWRAKRAAH